MQLDHKSKELLEILKKERSLVSPTTQDQKNNRQNTERVLGPDENIFRIDWVRHALFFHFEKRAYADT